MNQKIEISVITPSYNRANTLKRLYESLKKQTFKNFVWIIMDDGSTDNTKKMVNSFISEGILTIEYYYHKNKHKFITVFDGIEKVNTPYFIVIDSDDTHPKNSFQILYDEVFQIKNKEEFVSVMGNSVDEQGNLVGTPYPEDGFVGSILEMRYKYKVKGDKTGIFITDSYKKQMEKFDYAIYKNKGYIPENVFFSTYDGKLKTKFINKMVRTYLKDDDDLNSVSNTRWTGKNVFGLREGHKSFLNNYNTQLYRYPMPLIRNIIGFQCYSFLNNISVFSMIKEIKNPVFKTISVLLLPFSYLYYLIKMK
jgi:glycosyltransferase involved in cell wall biosynthesis